MTELPLTAIHIAHCCRQGLVFPSQGSLAKGNGGSARNLTRPAATGTGRGRVQTECEYLTPRCRTADVYFVVKSSSYTHLPPFYISRQPAVSESVEALSPQKPSYRQEASFLCSLTANFLSSLAPRPHCPAARLRRTNTPEHLPRCSIIPISTPRQAQQATSGPLNILPARPLFCSYYYTILIYPYPHQPTLPQTQVYTAATSR